MIWEVPTQVPLFIYLFFRCWKLKNVPATFLVEFGLHFEQNLKGLGQVPIEVSSFSVWPVTIIRPGLFNENSKCLLVFLSFFLKKKIDFVVLGIQNSKR